MKLIKTPEDELAQELRNLCYLNGREKNPPESAKILHKLGLEYKKRSPDKVSLIQSATLLNAAIVRNPDNVDYIMKDLESLCSKILQVAGSKKSGDSLLTFALTVNKAILQHREEVDEELKSLKHIPDTIDSKRDLHKLERNKIMDIQRLQSVISQKYTNIMDSISQYCVHLMGKPPSDCKFALVGMGSLARKEVTPYSDFENIIVLEEGVQLQDNYPDVVEYFRWFAVVFQIILVNQGETIIPSVAIPSLNDFTKPGGDWFFDAYTTSGISFDGLMPHACKSPLGRQKLTKDKMWVTELIKPVSEMASYLDAEQDLKNGYHLADVLSKTCFVSGDRGVFDDFSRRVTEKLAWKRKNSPEFIAELKKRISDDKLKFDVNESCSNMYTTNKFNMKSVIYRSTTIFISALGTYYGIEATSCFDIVESLAEKELITKKEKYKLTYAVAVACEVRLKIYMKRKRQSDWIEEESFSGESAEIVKSVGGRSIADYFTIARGFQRSISDLISKDATPICLNLQLDYRYTVDICCMLRLHETCIQICTSTLHSWKISLSKREEASCYYYMAMSLLDLRKPTEALKAFENELSIRKKTSSNEEADMYIADCYYNIGRCMAEMSLYEKAVRSFERELVIRKQITRDEKKDSDIAFCIREVATCLFKQGQHSEALSRYTKSLEIRERITENENKDVHIAHCVCQIGVCAMKLRRFEEAVQHFKRELTMRKKQSSDERSDFYVAHCLDQIGICFMNLEKYEESISYFEQALDIFNPVTTDIARNAAIAKCIYNMDVCKLFISKDLHQEDTPDLKIARTLPHYARQHRVLLETQSTLKSPRQLNFSTLQPLRFASDLSE